MTMFAMLLAGWLTPMFDNRGAGMYWTVLFTALIGGTLALLYVVRRITDVEPLAKGDARWRYRSRALRERIGQARTWLVPFYRTPGWLLTRLEFAIAIGAVLLPPLLVPGVMAPTFGDVSPLMGLAWLVIGEAASLVGIAWMVRIYRAPLRMDSKAYWRYHDGA